MAAAEVYIKELSRLKLGRPLYDPEDEIYVGDVGFFQSDSGNFRRLFNVLVDADHPSHTRYGVPLGFEPLSSDELFFAVKTSYFPPQVMTTKSVDSSNIDVEVSP
jgi:hypothetical protein